MARRRSSVGGAGGRIGSPPHGSRRRGRRPRSSPLKGSLHMKLGVNIGYWGLGLSSADQLEIVQEAERLGYDSVWAAEAYGSDAATILGWLAGPDERIRLGSAIFQMPAPVGRDDRDDRGDARPALGRAHAARHRLVGPAGGRGLARPALRPPAAAHARVRRGRPQGARARAARVPRRDARAAAARRPGQGAQADDQPRAGPDPDLPRGDRAEEHARWRARSPTAGCRPCSPPSTSPSCARCSRRAPRGRAARSTASTSRRRSASS